MKNGRCLLNELLAVDWKLECTVVLKPFCPLSYMTITCFWPHTSLNFISFLCSTSKFSFNGIKCENSTIKGKKTVAHKYVESKVANEFILSLFYCMEMSFLLQNSDIFKGTSCDSNMIMKATNAQACSNNL